MAANKFMQSMGSAFDRLGGQGDALKLIEENTRETKENLAVGGDLYSRIDELVTTITNIQDGKGKKGGGDIKQALAMAIIAPSMKPIGLGLQYVVDAINALEGSGSEITEKTEALIGGLTKLGEVGASILKFAGYMFLATPLLLIVALASPLIALSLFLILGAISLASKMLDDEKMETLGKLKGVGIGILVLAGSLALTSLIIRPAIMGAIGAVLLIGLIGFALMLIPQRSLNKMEQFGDGALKLALGLGAMVLVFAITSLIIPFAIKGAIASMLIIGAIGLTFFLLEKLGIMDKIEEGAKGLLMAAGAILGIGIALALFHIISPPMSDLLNIALIVGVIGFAFGIIGALFGKHIEKGAKALLWAGLAIIVLGLALLLFVKIVGNISGGDIVNSFAPLILIGLIGVAFYVAGLVATEIAKGAGAMILAGISIIILAVGFLILRKAMGDKGWTFIGQSLALITGIGVVMGVAGLAAPFIALGAGAMILAGVALILIGAAMAILKKLDFKAMTKGGGILGDSGQKTKGFMGIGGGRPKTNMEVMMEAIGNSFMLSPFAIGAMYLGAPALIMAGVALLTIGAGISKFQKIAKETNLKTLGVNVNEIVFTLSNTFGKIGKMFPGGQQSLFSSVFGGGSGGSAVAQGISSTMGMGKALTGIARGMQAMANLKFPTKFDKEGNPIEFESMDSDAPKRVADNAAMITMTLATVFGDIGKKYPGGKKSLFQSIFGGGKSNPVADGISATMGMGKALTGIASGFQNMANLKFATGYDKEGKATGYESINIETSLPKVMANTKAIVIGLSSVFAEVGSSQGAQGSTWFSSSTYDKGVAVVQEMGMPLVNLASGVQAMANLKFPTGFDKDGKPTGFETISDVKGIKSKIGTNTRMLIEALTDVFTVIGGGKSKTSSWWQGETKFEKGIEVVNMVGEPYKKLADSIKDIIGLVGKLDTKAFSGKIEDIVGVFTADEIVGADIGLMNSKRWLTDSIGSTFEKLGKGVPAITSALAAYKPEIGKSFFGNFVGPVDLKDINGSYTNQRHLWNAVGANMTTTAVAMPGISTAINSMDMEKLVESRKLFEALGVLSNGGEPSDILGRMGESLEEALQNLADMLQEFKGSVEEGVASQSAATGGLSDTLSNMGKAMNPFSSSKNSSSGGDGGSDKVVSAVKALQSALISQGIKVKKGGGFFG